MHDCHCSLLPAIPCMLYEHTPSNVISSLHCTSDGIRYQVPIHLFIRTLTHTPPFSLVFLLLLLPPFRTTFQFPKTISFPYFPSRSSATTLSTFPLSLNRLSSITGILAIPSRRRRRRRCRRRPLKNTKRQDVVSQKGETKKPKKKKNIF